MVCPGGGFRDNGAVRVRFLLGPAGAGKTFRCLTEVRQALWASPEGAPLLLVAPKQTTYQLERQLLADPLLPGYTRLHILSFERLAHFIFGQLGRRAPEMLDEEGRLMVLRALLARKRDDLKLFRASARLTGFAQQLSLVLRELQRNQLTPESLRELAGQVQEVEGLAPKLHDLATLLQDYLDWLKAHNLQDTDSLLATAAEAMREFQSPRSNSDKSRAGVQSPKSAAGSRESGVRNQAGGNPKSEIRKAEGSPVAVPSDFGLRTSDFFRPSDFGLRISSLWVDGFAEFSDQELDLVAALLPCCEAATISFCLDRAPSQKVSWLSSWSVTRKTFEDCRKRFGGVADADIVVEVLERRPDKGRFADSPVLQHLERCWAEPQPVRPWSNFEP